MCVSMYACMYICINLLSRGASPLGGILQGSRCMMYVCINLLSRGASPLGGILQGSRCMMYVCIIFYRREAMFWGLFLIL